MHASTMNLKHVLHAVSLLCCHLVAAVLSDYPADGSDLSTYISRPDIRSPKLNITVYEPDAVEHESLWFVAPYVNLQNHPRNSFYTPLQMGPHLYDSHGELVWSGAHLYPGRSVFDFKITTIHDKTYLSFILLGDMTASELKAGANIILDSSYKVSEIMTNSRGRGQGMANMHEFSVVENGKSTLTILSGSHYVDVTSMPINEPFGWILDEGFQETDMEGNILFEWWALDHLMPSESMQSRYGVLTGASTEEDSWDFFHMNSVDKLQDTGDYLISARYTSTIYRISGKDGSIVWRLGGKHSSFTTQDFTFSNQHDARLLSENSTTTVVSFMNNAANNDLRSNTSDHSSALIVALDTTTMTARTIHEYTRPDGGFTRLRGNVQQLPNNHTFVGWSENNYVSEYDTTGRMILEGQLTTHRYDCYRSYKFPWTSFVPSEPPAIRSIAYGSTVSRATTVVYVSWNGATEVAEWRVFADMDPSTDARALEEGNMIGSIPRQGFETSLMLDGFHDRVYAEAYTKDGRQLARSEFAVTDRPRLWSDAVSKTEWNISDEDYVVQQQQALTSACTSKSLAEHFRSAHFAGKSVMVVAFMLAALAIFSMAQLSKVLVRRRPVWWDTAS